MTIKKDAVRRQSSTKGATDVASEIETHAGAVGARNSRKEQCVEGLGCRNSRREFIAERLGKMISAGRKEKSSVGTLDITFYRDDFRRWGPRRCAGSGIVFPSKARRSMLSTMCCIPAAPRAPLSTPFFPMAAPACPVAGA